MLEMCYSIVVETQENGVVAFNGPTVEPCYSNTAPACVGLTAPSLRLDNDGTQAGVFYSMTRRSPQPFADCHPDRPHVARGFCGACYQRWTLERKRTKAPVRYCKCGCGGIVSPDAKFVLGHHARFMTDETRAKMSAVRKGRPVSQEQREKISRANKGHATSDNVRQAVADANRRRVISEETRFKMSAAHVGKDYLSAEGRQRLSDKHRGKIISAETRAKLSRALTGRKISADVQAKINAALPRGINHPRWRGGVDRRYVPGWNEIRVLVRERDGYKCLLCGRVFEFMKRGADVHHTDKNRYNNELWNLISLCTKCHRPCDNNISVSMPMLRAILAERYGYVY